MTGYTEEEVFLNKLAAKSFLKFWSWPNLFRDQGDCDKNGDGKEICDLTVVFGDDVILFSDKKIKFNADKDLKVAWSRWSRKAIGSSVKQVKGARRWFEKFPDRIYVDSKCQHQIPISIPDGNSIRIHNVVVCHGIEDVLSCHNREASFVFDNSIRGDAHWNESEPKLFCIGQIFEGGFVHMFNESTIELVLNEFDTTKDFISYLEQREALLCLDKHIIILSESDIMQLYYEGFDESSERRSIISEALVETLSETNSVVIDMGGVHRLFQNPSYLAKQKEDEISYFWDRLIESFSFHILNDSVDYKSWGQPKEAEPCIRFLASTSRFERRILADAFKGFYEKITPGYRGTRVCLDPTNQENAYVFCIVPMDHSFSSEEDYREIRRKMLQDYCVINKHLDRKIKCLFGIACKTRINDHEISPYFFAEGQDFIFLDGNEWKEEDYLEAELIHDEYVFNGLLAARRVSMETINEFPRVGAGFREKLDVNGKDRNKPCVCGSGKKIKKCCGRPQ